jgi:hypothetical protein
MLELMSGPIEFSIIIYSIIGLISGSLIITALLYLNKKWQDNKCQKGFK